MTVQESITVTGESPLVEVSKTTLGTTIYAKKLEELPMAGHLPLAPDPRRGRHVAGRRRRHGVAGRNSGRTGYVVDGVSQERNVFPSARGSLSPDSVQEFRILTNMFSAEYGQASGPIVNILTWSGTNALHGRVGAFTRLNERDARDYFATGEAPYSQQWYWPTSADPSSATRRTTSAHSRGSRPIRPSSSRLRSRRGSFRRPSGRRKRS